MHMRLQSTPAERREFAERLARARGAKSVGFHESPQSVLGEIHLTYGHLWALFDEEGPERDEMLGGFVSHNLAMFPQSYPRPDLTYLPPESVVECSELWALAPGAARLARHAGFILAGPLNVRAILAYVMVKPRNTSSLYKTFSRVGEPINWHYAKAFDGTDAWGQAMVLEGRALEMTVQVATELSFESFDGRCLQFRNPFPIAPRINRRTPRHIRPLDRMPTGDRIVQLQLRR